MNKLSFILISLTVLIHNIEAQVTKASPEEFKILKSRPLIVELAEQDKEYIESTEKSILKANNPQRKERLQKDLDGHKNFVAIYNATIKEAIENYWGLNKNILYKTVEEVKDLRKAKSTKYTVLFYSMSSTSGSASVGYTFNSGQAIPTLNYSRIEEGTIKVDYSFFIPSTGDRAGDAMVLSDFALSFRIMKNQIEEIEKTGQKNYTTKKFGKDQAEVNCKKLAGKTIYFDETFLKDKVDDSDITNVSGNNIEFVSHNKIGEAILKNEDKLITVNIPWGIAEGGTGGSLGALSAGITVSRIQFMKSIINAKTGEILYVYGISMGEMYDWYWRVNQISKLGDCD